MAVVAETKDQTGRAPWDYFSWGHVDMGIASYLLLSLINTVPSWLTQTKLDTIFWWVMLVVTIVVAVVWELMENTLFIKMGIKFENRRDSLANATWDIIFAIIGGAYVWGIKGIMVNLIGVQLIPAFYLVGIVSFIIVLIAFFIGRGITKE